ncbi:hypothetical protein K1X76_11310, partial [bacterium]|nr:hypothetical protein [bacterium]
NLGYIGVTYVPKKLHAAYWKACDEVLHTFGEKANVEMVVNYLGKEGVPVTICDVSGSTWIEVDTPEDHKIALTKLEKLV